MFASFFSRIYSPRPYRIKFFFPNPGRVWRQYMGRNHRQHPFLSLLFMSLPHFMELSQFTNKVTESLFSVTLPLFWFNPGRVWRQYVGRNHRQHPFLSLLFMSLPHFMELSQFTNKVTESLFSVTLPLFWFNPGRVWRQYVGRNHRQHPFLQHGQPAPSPGPLQCLQTACVCAQSRVRRESIYELVTYSNLVINR